MQEWISDVTSGEGEALYLDAFGLEVSLGCYDLEKDEGVATLGSQRGNNPACVNGQCLGLPEFDLGLYYWPSQGSGATYDEYEECKDWCEKQREA